jgi:hypothetical protein
MFGMEVMWVLNTIWTNSNRGFSRLGMTIKTTDWLKKNISADYDEL